jgi:hypothetical protein
VEESNQVNLRLRKGRIMKMKMEASTIVDRSYRYGVTYRIACTG